LRFGAGLFGLSPALELSKLGDRPEHARLDPPFVQLEAVEQPRIERVLRKYSAEARIGLHHSRVGERPAHARRKQGPGDFGHAPSGRFQNLGVNGLILQALGAQQSPREADDPLSQHGFHRPYRLEIGQKGLAIQIEFSRVFAADHRFTGKQPVFERVLRGRRLALICLWAG
jgi:hypothetical protein